METMEPRRDRLTERNANGGIAVRDLPAALEKLAFYEDAEEQGRLVWLPVKPGGTVYTLVSQSGPIQERVVRDICIDSPHGDTPDIEATFYTRRADGEEDTMYYFMPDDIGISVFLTRADAEEALQARNAAQ